METKSDMNIERQVIGALILNPDNYFNVNEILSANTFTGREEKAIFEAFEKMFNSDLDITLILLQEQIHKAGHTFDILSIIDDLNSGHAFIDHCRVLKEKEIRKEQSKLGSEILLKSNDPEADPFETNDHIMSEAERVVSMVDFGKKKSNADLIQEVKRKMKHASNSGGMTGLLTGFEDLDRIYGGRQNSDLIIKAARPAMGKTSQALCEAKHMAFEDNRKVVFFSLEMSCEQLMQRLVSVHTGIQLNKIRNGSLTSEQWNAYYDQEEYLSNDNLMIVDDVYSLNAIKTRCRKLKMKGALDVVYIDYLQLINHKVDRGRSKENEVSEISRSLKMLAKSLDVPVVVLSQLSRAVESRGGDKHPMLSDLRDSGAIEQDADIVEFIFRPEYYDQDDLSLCGKAYVLISKNRNGACGDIELFFNKECTRFENPNYDNESIQRREPYAEADF
jgi:replicative DNA helicase